MDNLLILLSVYCSFAPLTAIFALTPYLSKKNSVFGVMLTEDAKNTSEVKKISRSYTVFALVGGVILSSESAIAASMFILGISLCSYVLLCLGLYALNNRLIRNLIITKDYENLQKEVFIKQIPQKYNVKLISIWWYIILILPLAISIYFEIITPVAYGFIIPIIQGVIFIAAIAIYAMMKRLKHYVNKNDVEKSVIQNIAFRKKWSFFTIIAGISVSSVLTLMELELLGIIKGTVIITAAPFTLTILITILAIVFAIKD